MRPPEYSLRRHNCPCWRVNSLQNKAEELGLWVSTDVFRVNTVTRRLREFAGVTDATVDLARGEAVISGTHLDGAALAAAVQALGYDAIQGPINS